MEGAEGVEFVGRGTPKIDVHSRSERAERRLRGSNTNSREDIQVDTDFDIVDATALRREAFVMVGELALFAWALMDDGGRRAMRAAADELAEMKGNRRDADQVMQIVETFGRNTGEARQDRGLSPATKLELYRERLDDAEESLKLQLA